MQRSISSRLGLRSRAATAARRLYPGRFRIAGTLVLTYLALNFAVRLGLACFNGEAAAFAPPRMFGWLALGAGFDLAVAWCATLPFVLLAWLTPDTARTRPALAAVAVPAVLAMLAAFVFIAAAEFVFWNEFGTRFNFISVDYLIYTREVIGNIRESYPMPLLLGAVGALVLLASVGLARPLWRATAATGSSLAMRTRTAAALIALPALALAGISGQWKDFTSHAASAQLAGNGVYEFVRAFRTNEIDYAQFYRTLPAGRALATLRRAWNADAPQAQPAATAHSIAPQIVRDVRASGPEHRWNVVLISVESLSAEFMGAFGNGRGLTPRLDALARDGALFTRLYATGTRTVRGLEAITLSMPPTPGHSIVKRPDNAGLFTLGGVFAARGYEPIYLYGGYSYFDNMQAFFGGNGYTVVDRSALASSEISYENIWGVADEDLFRLTLRELDQRHAAGRPFFAHVMTTSNHRPYTYPAGRIDIAPSTGRDGAVKYTDWAIGRFIDEARTRPWFEDTVFVIVADHCASSRGKTELPTESFHIPLIVYAPAHLAPRRIDTLASQIDVAPTLLALLNFSYRSKFFGQDILAATPAQGRALMANYQTVGYLQDDVLVELRPKARVRIVDGASQRELTVSPQQAPIVDLGIAYYEIASEAFRSGALRTAAGEYLMPEKVAAR